MLPLGLGYIASVIRGEGHAVRILDINGFGYSNKKVEEIIKDSKFDIAGIGGLTSTYKYVKWLSKIIRKHKSNVLIVAGNMVSTAHPEMLLKNSCVDIAVIDEGEITFKELVSALRAGKGFGGINGIYYKNNGEILKTPPRERISDLDTLPFPAWDLLPMETYLNNSTTSPSSVGLRQINVSAVRGCPYECTFCSRPFGKQVFIRSARNTIDEVRELKKRYQVEFINFSDDLFLANEKFVLEFCDMMISENLNIKWSTSGRVNLVNDKLLRKMRRAGCVELGFGFESGSQIMLDNMKKRVTVKQAEEAIKITRAACIKVSGSFIIGMPGETLNTIKETLAFIKRNHLPIYRFFYATPYPHTELYSIAKKMGRFPLDEDAYLEKLGEMRTTFLVNLTNFSDTELVRLKNEAELRARKNRNAKLRLDEFLENWQGRFFTIHLSYRRGGIFGMVKTIFSRILQKLKLLPKQKEYLILDKEKKFFDDVIIYSSSNMFSNILNFITGIVVRRILQPALMGLFNEVMLVFDYGRYAHLGIIDALDRELPYFYGKANNEKFELLKNIGFMLCLVVGLGISASLFLASFFTDFGGGRLLLNGIRIASFMIIAQMLSSLFVVLNRSRNKFLVISKYTILVAILDIILKTILIIKFGFYGLLWASFFTLIIGLIYFYFASGIKFVFSSKFPFDEIERLFRIGFPIFIAGFVLVTLRNIDRIMIIRLLGTKSLGFYTIALMVSAYAVQLPNLIYSVIFPRFYQAYGAKQSIFEIKELFINPTVVFAYFFPVFVGIIIIILPLLVQYILPAYLPGLLPAYFLLLGSSFLALVNMPGYLLIALNKQIYMVVIGLLSISLGVGLNYLFVRKLNMGLPGVAIATGIAYFAYATILIYFAFLNYTKKFLAHAIFFCQLYSPLVWVIVILLILKVFTFKASGDLARDSLLIFLKSAVFLASCIPLLIYANKKTAIVSLLKSTYLKNNKKNE